MSRGHGRIQRAVLAYFEENPEAKSPILEIAGESLGKDSITPSEYESFRRAIESLLVAGELMKIPCQLYGGGYPICTPETYSESWLNTPLGRHFCEE